MSCFRVGGGDVKLVAMMGAFLGPETGVEVLLWTFVVGGCAGLTLLVWQVGPSRIAAAAWSGVLGVVRSRQMPMISRARWAQLQYPLHLAPCALIAALAVHFSLLEWVGERVGL
jgi:prepilin peptidase CpaA